MRKFIQRTYIVLFVFLTLGIVGNIELGEKIPTWGLITYPVVSFLTIGKVIYLSKKEEK